MTSKEKFLNTLQAKIRMYQEAYNANKDLPDEVFESGSFAMSTVVRPQGMNGKKNKAGKYGVNITTVRELIRATGSDGILKQDILNDFPEQDEKKKYTVVTNALSALNQGEEIEKFKKRGKKMRGYYWRMKNISA